MSFLTESKRKQFICHVILSFKDLSHLGFAVKCKHICMDLAANPG